jgi:hypothetical protein
MLAKIDRDGQNVEQKNQKLYMKNRDQNRAHFRNENRDNKPECMEKNN